MNKLYIYIIGLCGILAVLSGCREGIDVFEPYENQSAAAVSKDDFFVNAQKEGDTYSFSVEEGIEIITPEGTRIFFEPNSLVSSNGNSISGIVELEVIELSNAADMIVYDRPAITHRDELLNSVGSYFIRAMQNNTELKLADDKSILINIPTNDYKEQMELFYGFELEDVFAWREADNNPSVTSNVWPSEIEYDNPNNWTTSFEMTSQELGWIGCKTYAASDGLTNETSSKICIDLPLEYEDRNTLVFIIFEDINGITQIHSNPFKTEFCNDNLPEGAMVTIVVVSVQGEDEYHLGYKDITISDNLDVAIHPESTNLQGILDILESL